MNSNGVDISKYQGTPDIGKMIGMSDFVIHRYSCGYWKDEKIDRNWELLKDNVITGLYHFVHPEYMASARVQKDHLLAMIEMEANLPIILDIEHREVYIKQVYSYAYYIWQKSGKYPIIYTAPAIWKALWAFANTTHAKFFRKCPLWIANYDVDIPFVPEPWDKWTFWQYTIETNRDVVEDYGLRYWESKAIDLDYYNGDYEDLVEFVNLELPGDKYIRTLPDMSADFLRFRNRPEIYSGDTLAAGRDVKMKLVTTDKVPGIGIDYFWHVEFNGYIGYVSAGTIWTEEV